MAPRRRRRVAPQGTPNLKAIAFQIVALILALVAVLALTQRFSTGSGHLVEFLTDDADLDVDAEAPPAAEDPTSEDGDVDHGNESSEPNPEENDHVP